MQHWVEEIKLSNGIEGLLIDAPSTNVTYFDLVFRAGYYLSPTDKMDTAHIMEHLALGANSKFKKASDYSQEFTKHGAYNNAYTGDYHMGYVAECAEFETERILDLLCLAIESPLFQQQEFESEVANVREELKMRRNYHDTELLLELENKMGFVGKSYTQRTKELSTVTLDDVKNHYKKTHFASNMRFIIAGPLARHKLAIIKRLESINLPQGNGQIKLPDEPAKDLEKPLILTQPGLDNVYYRWVSVFDRLLSRHEKYSLYAVQDYLFSTFHSKVFGKARERGLIYGIDSSYYRSKNNHIWVVSGQVQADNAVPLFRLISKELQSIKNGKITKEELDGIKAYEWGSFQKSIQTISSLADWYQYAYFVSGVVKEYPAVEEQIMSVKMSGMRAVVEKLFKSPAWGLGLMYNGQDELPAEALDKIIAKNYQ